MAEFYEFRRSKKQVPESARILAQAKEAGFSGRLKIYNLGFDTEDSMSLVIEGAYEGQRCSVAVGYGMNRQRLAIRKKWTRHAPISNR